MVLGRGFVRSGSGYVSTPTTRAAARAAGTFGGEGVSGAQSAAAGLGSALGLDYSVQVGDRLVPASKAYAAMIGTRKRGSGLKVTEAEAAQKAAESAARSEETVKLRAAATAAKQAKDRAEVERLRALRETKTATSTITTTDTEKTTGVASCPRGLRYTKLTRWSSCDPGYVSTKGSGLTILGQSIYPYMPGNECVCVNSEAGQAIIKTESEPKPTDLPGNGEEEGEGFFGGFLGEGEDTGKLGGIVLLVVGGAIVVALLGLFKK